MNKIELQDKNKKIIGYCIVSPEHYEHLNQFQWSKNFGHAVRTSIDDTNRRMHRYIMIDILGHKLTSPDLVVDHINCDPLDNRKENLQIITRYFSSSKKIKK